MLYAAWIAVGCNAAPDVSTPTQPDNGEKVIVTDAKFEDVAASRDLQWTYRNGREANVYAIVESLGGGAGWIDYDGDGYQDALISGGGTFGPQETIVGYPPTLRRNTGKRFVDVTAAAGLLGIKYVYNHAITAGDFNEDGFPDFLLTGYGGLHLFQNQGDGTFREVTAEADLDSDSWASSAAWGDLDGDGCLDLYVAHYVNWSFANNPLCPGPEPGMRDLCPPRAFDGLNDKCFRSDGAGGFVDATREMGLVDSGKGLGVMMMDIDVDGDLDVYVANDSTENFLYQNDGLGHLTNIGLRSGAAMGERGTPDGSMGVDITDFNGDGLPDIWVANFENESLALYRNLGEGLFRHDSRALGITALGGLYVGWGTAFTDFDHDGDQDVFVSNGHVIYYPLEAPVRQKPILLENLSGQRFINVASLAGEYLTQQHMGRGVACGDVDNDGDEDLLVVHTNEPVALLLNQTETDNHWFGLRLIGTRSCRDAVGARIRITTGSGTQTRQRKGGGSYASTNDQRLFFGLAGDTRIDELQVHWPSGQTQVLSNLPADQLLTLIEPQ